MRFLAAIIVLIASCSSALAQTRNPAEISTQQNATPQPYEILDKTGKWMAFGSAVNGVFLDMSRAVSPISFGAKCDGVTNDDAALHAWAASFKAGTQAVVPGICVFTNTITFPNVRDVAITGNGTAGTLLYAGTNTTTDLLVFGIPTSQNDGGCMVGWTLNGLRLQSNTNMTAGAGIKFNFLCEANIANLDAGGGIGGNENLWDGVWFKGGNSIRIRGFSFRGTNVAEVITGWSTTYTSIDIMHMQGVISHSGTGVLLGGGAAGTMYDQTDILINGENMRISQERVTLPNFETFLGPNVFLDVPDFARAGATGVGLHINEPNANPEFSILNMTGTWISGARQCILIEPESRWTIKWVGGLSHICVPQAGEASIENRSFNARIMLDGVRFYQPLLTAAPGQGNLATKGPYIEQLGSSFYGAGALIMNNVRMADNPSGYITGPWVGDYMRDNGKRVVADDTLGNRVVQAPTNKYVLVGTDWGNRLACGLKIIAGNAFPSDMNQEGTACTFDMGASGAPLRFVWANIFSSQTGNTQVEAQNGSVNIVAKKGYVNIAAPEGNVMIQPKASWHTVIGSGGGKNCAIWIREASMFPAYADGSAAPSPPCGFRIGEQGWPFFDIVGSHIYADTQFYGTLFHPKNNAAVNFKSEGGQLNLTATGNRLVATAGADIQLMAEASHNIVMGSGGNKDCALWLQKGRIIPGYADMTSAPTPPCQFYAGTTAQPFWDVHSNHIYAEGKPTSAVFSNLFQPVGTGDVTFQGAGGNVYVKAPGNQLRMSASDNVLIQAGEARSTQIGVGTNGSACYLWIQAGFVGPVTLAGTLNTPCGAPLPLGSSVYPFNQVWAKTNFAVSTGGANPTTWVGETDDTVNPNGTNCNMVFKGGLLITHNGC